jgi:aminoglycoside phosphotransferase (APT) family kinase protein
VTSEQSSSAGGRAAVPRGIDAPRLERWFAEHIADAAPPLRFALIPGGHSNLTYRIDDARGHAYVLRRPPLGAVLATAHDMAREHRVIAALAPAGVPVPPALGLCEDPEVNGAPFYVMRYVEGVVLADADAVEQHFTVSMRGKIGESTIDVLAQLHGVDPDAVGLGDLGRRDAYVERQLRRWRTQWEKTRTRDLPLMDQLYDQLCAAVPAQDGSTVVHGDYRLGNMITASDGRIAAVLDWELCTLGDPLADLGYLINNWAARGEEGPTRRGAALAPTAAGGFPERQQLLDRYAARSGRDLRHIDYYRAFQYWRLAAIVEGVMARYLQGVMGSTADTESFRKQVDELAAAARERLERL